MILKYISKTLLKLKRIGYYRTSRPVFQKLRFNILRISFKVYKFEINTVTLQLHVQSTCFKMVCFVVTGTSRESENFTNTMWPLRFYHLHLGGM